MQKTIELTRQEYFDIAVGGLIKQGCRAADSENVCLYRTKEGHKCALGHIIPDELYEEDMEGWEINVPSPAPSNDRYDFSAIIPRQEDRRFILELQSIHDQDRNFYEMPEDYRRLASRNNLSLEVFEQ